MEIEPNNDKQSLNSDPNEQYLVEKIISRRVTNDETIYTVKWKGYDDESDNSDLSLQELIDDNCFEPIFNFENQPENQKERPKDVQEFLKLYEEFNPKVELQYPELGNFRMDDQVECIEGVYINKEKQVFIILKWKPREDGTLPKKSRYHYKVVQHFERDLLNNFLKGNGKKNN